MGSFSPFHWLILLPLLLMFILGPLALLIVLLRNPKTRVAVMVLLSVPAVLLMLALLGVVVGLSSSMFGNPQSIDEWKVDLARHSNSAEAHYNLGKALAQCGRFDEAAVHLQAALRIKPKYAEAHYTLGKALAEQSKFDEAIAHYQKALKIKPDYAEARDARDELLSEQASRKTASHGATHNAVATSKVEKDDAAATAVVEATDAAPKDVAPPEATRPAWVDAAPRVADDVYQTAITVGPYTTRLECETKLPEAIGEAVNQYAEICFGPDAVGKVDLPDANLCRRLVKERWEEITQSSVGPMTQLHVLLQFDRKVKDRIADACNQVVIRQRLWITGIGVTGVLGLLAVAFGYLKIDELTGGAYRGRLRLTAALAILGLVAAAVMAQ
jgi:hypothetical protein